MSQQDLASLGGSLGRHASSAARSLPRAAAGLVGLSTLTMAVAVVERGYCISNGWSGPSQFWRACYSDLPVFYAAGMGGGLPEYVGSGATTSVAQPVVTGSVLAFVGGLVPTAGPLADQTRWYFLLFAFLATALVAALVWITAASRPLDAGDAAKVAVAPVLVTAALVSADLIGVVLASAGVLAWARRRPALAGVLLGLAVAARTYPVLLVLGVVLLSLRSGRLRDAGRLVAAGGATVGVVLLPFLLGNTAAITAPYAAWRASGAGLGSVWVIGQLARHPLPAGLVLALAVSGMVLAVGLGVVLTLVAPRRPGVAEVGLVMVATVLVTGASFPVQSSLWLVPLVALCGLPWRDWLLWCGAEAVYFVAVWLYLGLQSAPARGLPAPWYAVFLMVRVVAVVYLGWRVWRTAMDRPPVGQQEAEDADPPATGVEAPVEAPVGQPIEHDALAGPLSGASDRLVVRLT